MSFLASRPSRPAACAAALAVGVALAGPAAPAYAAELTLTAINPARLPAGQAGKQVVLYGTGYDEELIGAVGLGGDPACAKLTTYVVLGRTQILVKTPAGGCAASANGLAEAVTVYGPDLSTVLVTKPSLITFLPPPVIVAAGDKPVVTENSSALPVTDQVTALNAAGGQIIRIRAGAGFAFDGRSAAALSGTLNGKALSTAGFLAPDGTTPQAAGSAPAGVGNYWLARTAAGLGAAATPALVITQNTGSRTFTAEETGLSVVSTPVVTALDVRSGKIGAATKVRISGSGFGADAAGLSVTMCGKVAPITGTPTANIITAQAPNDDPATPAGSRTTAAELIAALGGTSGVCAVVVTRGTGAAVARSPVTALGSFAFLDR